MQESEGAIYRCRRRVMVEPMTTDWKGIYFRGLSSAYSDGVKALGFFFGKILATWILFRHLTDCH